MNLQNKKFLFAFFIFLILISFNTNYVKAANISIGVNSDYPLSYQQGKAVDLNIPCYSDSNYCPGIAICRITVSYPNGTILINNQPMAFNPSFFSFSFNSNQTKSIGFYHSSMVCSVGPDNGAKDFSFEITTTGARNELAIEIIAFALIIVAIIIFDIGLSRQDWVITMLSSFIFGIAGFSLYLFPLVYLPTQVNTVLYWVLWGIGVYILLKTSIEVAGGALGND
jgi:hypothetical protein